MIYVSVASILEKYLSLFIIKNQMNLFRDKNPDFICTNICQYIWLFHHSVVGIVTSLWTGTRAKL